MTDAMEKTQARWAAIEGKLGDGDLLALAKQVIGAYRFAADAYREVCRAEDAEHGFRCAEPLANAYIMNVAFIGREMMNGADEAATVARMGRTAAWLAENRWPCLPDSVCGRNGEVRVGGTAERVHEDMKRYAEAGRKLRSGVR